MLKGRRSDRCIEPLRYRPIRHPEHVVVPFEGAFNDSCRGDIGDLGFATVAYRKPGDRRAGSWGRRANSAMPNFARSKSCSQLKVPA
jgi:hypothetical protein